MSDKQFKGGTERTVPPEVTLERVRPWMPALGITRIANVTGLDRLGVPTVAVYRPNSRSLAVSQGKGATLVEAMVSGVMESLECYHAEHSSLPLLLASYDEARLRHEVVDVGGLPRLQTSTFKRSLPLLWASGIEMNRQECFLVPHELVHLDFRVPLPSGSAAFFMSSNGLSSGNTLPEAILHGLCELIERDANTLFHASSMDAQQRCRVDLSSITDSTCAGLIERFVEADLMVGIWDTTSDVGLASFLCTLVDRDPRLSRPMPAISGSGCHPRRRVALVRALTEAAQGRLTVIAGSRDDLSSGFFDASSAISSGDAARDLLRGDQADHPFTATVDTDHATFEDDVEFSLRRLEATGMRQVIVVNLTDPRIDIPVVRVVIPYLEAMSEVRGYLPGRRAESAAARSS